MSKVTVKEAAALTGKSRETINKATKDGTLSFTLNAQNHKVIDIAELERVHPLIKTMDEVSKPSEPVMSGQAVSDSQIAAELAVLRERLDSSERMREVTATERERERRQLESEIEALRANVENSQELHNKALLLVTDRSQQPHDREALLEQSRQELDQRMAKQQADFEKRIESLRKEAKRDAIEEIMSRPWWRAFR